MLEAPDSDPENRSALGVAVLGARRSVALGVARGLAEDDHREVPSWRSWRSSSCLATCRQRSVGRRTKRRSHQESGLSYFQMRCKESGDRITRKVEGVDGIALLKIRPATGEL